MPKTGTPRRAHCSDCGWLETRTSVEGLTFRFCVRHGLTRCESDLRLMGHIRGGHQFSWCALQQPAEAFVQLRPVQRSRKVPGPVQPRPSVLCPC